MIFSKATETAIAAMSRLAEIYDGAGAATTSAEIAQNRHIPQPSVAKVLTQLAQRGLVAGTQGRKGGYGLARPPAEISLLDIARCFERDLRITQCPFGPGYCGTNDPCPLHHEYVKMHAGLHRFLERTTLAGFRDGSRKRLVKPARP